MQYPSGYTVQYCSVWEMLYKGTNVRDVKLIGDHMEAREIVLTLRWDWKTDETRKPDIF